MIFLIPRALALHSVNASSRKASSLAGELSKSTCWHGTITMMNKMHALMISNIQANCICYCLVEQFVSVDISINLSLIAGMISTLSVARYHHRNRLIY
jgi:hypothetical protein